MDTDTETKETNAEKETKTLYFIAADNVKFTGKISWQFIFDAGIYGEIPTRVMDKLRFGCIEVKAKGDDHFSPFKWAKSCRLRKEGKEKEANEIQFIGDDGVLRLNVYVFESGRECGSEQIMFAGIDENADDSVKCLLKDVPESSILLVHKALAMRISAACEELEFNGVIFEHSGELSTARS